jgi:monoamine oxidase
MVNLPIAFYKSLTSQHPKEYGELSQDSLGKVTWMGGTYVTGVHKSNKNEGIILAYRKGTGSEIMYDSFDYGISAVPMSVLREAEIRPLFSGKKMEAISRIRYVDAQKTLLLCSERFWEKQGIRGGSSSTDEIIRMISYSSDHAFCDLNTPGCSPEEPGVLVASYNIDQDAVRLGNTVSISRYRLINRLVEKVHGLPKGYLDSKVITAKTVDWNKEMWAQGAFCFFLPGQKKDFLFVSTMPEYNNRVFFAGEHASTKNAWIQGALQSGMLAANNLAYHALRHSR